jgi:hypothetical protein
MKYPSSPNPFSQVGRRGTGAQNIDIAHRTMTRDSIVGWALPTTLVFIDFHCSIAFDISEDIDSNAR